MGAVIMAGALQGCPDVPEGVFIDALPYIDQEYGSIAGIRNEVERLVRDEMATFKPQALKTPAPDSTDDFKSSQLLAEDFERMKRKEEMSALDVKRYRMEAPEDDEKMPGWKNAMNNGKSQVQHQAVRIENLDLMSEHGPMAWRMYNVSLEATHAGVKKKLEETKKEIEEVNKRRKIEQTEGGLKVRELEQQWEELMKKNLNIDAACQSLDRDISALKQQKGEGAA